MLLCKLEYSRALELATFMDALAVHKSACCTRCDTLEPAYSDRLRNRIIRNAAHILFSFFHVLYMNRCSVIFERCIERFICTVAATESTAPTSDVAGSSTFSNTT
jgi:hypothetical protein